MRSRKTNKPACILNFGSLNIDHVYGVDHFVRPGETLGGLSYRTFMGGKGGNQSLALARAGARVAHAGNLGLEGAWIKKRLEADGVDTTFVQITNRPGGHAVIQVNRRGENAIILFGGANRAITQGDARGVLRHFKRGDYLLLQNEISSIPEIMRLGSKQKMKIVFNPAPMQRETLAYPLHLVDTFIINEIEGEQLTGQQQPLRIVEAARRFFPRAAIVLTLGAQGVLYADGEQTLKLPSPKVKVVDTTAAGDTFIGYLLAEISRGVETRRALELACRAAAICVTRRGAADSIPRRSEVASCLPV